jgi:hypothetical protein
MSNTQCFRDYAAECLLSAENCQRGYRDLFLSISTCWYSLARQDEAVNTLLATWQIPELEAMAGLHHANNSEAERTAFGLNSSRPCARLF